ncbi:hypothetical protein M011DRAFT_479413 [Sporormia fimetaria CBS 119925]|uniref:Uncharacterized protein n=1 Tax=Sporormia fimetaria CBS 119925 TaxID=1340428 RepID=A0A6A6V5Z7_9PLEO|nr:hypothetical protein M011DRAFT_479413 [Sporormia fimetaria CBS 119925]
MTSILIGSLSASHSSTLRRAVFNILSTQHASDGFAQVVDGMPTRGRYRDYYGSYREEFEQNVEPSTKAKEIVQSHRDNLELSAMRVNATVAKAFENAPEGSDAFRMRLLEIIAIILHDMAVHLFNKFDGGINKPEPQKYPTPPPGIEPAEPRNMPTELFHTHYLEHGQYPNGIADVVGYWLEWYVFGGVIVFDRGQSGKECRSAFIHPVGKRQIFELSESQVNQFSQLVTAQSAESLGAGEVLVFKAEKTTQRVQPYEAFVNMNIYRDRYERKPSLLEALSCVVRDDNPPEQELLDEMVDWNGNKM